MSKKNPDAKADPGRKAVLNINRHGAWLSENEGRTWLPAGSYNGLCDQDTVWVRPRRKGPPALSLVSRTRSSLAGVVNEDDEVVIDPVIASMRVPAQGATPGHIVIVSGDDVTEVGPSTEAYPLSVLCMHRHKLPHINPETPQMAATPEASARVDATHMHTITIDADHSVDLDDAISARVEDDGVIRVWVHIADVAEVVTQHSEVDLYAKARATSVYLPGGVWHMLPNTLAATQCSLLPGVERDVLTVEMRIDAQGEILSVDVYQARIRSAERVNYHQVQAHIKNPTNSTLNPDTASVVSLAWTAAARLDAGRTARSGSDAWGRADEENREAHLLIERLMVAANESVGGWMTERGLPSIWRTHTGFTDSDATSLEAFGKACGIEVHLPRPVTAQAVVALGTAVAPTRHRAAFAAKAQALLNRATYTAVPLGHFGLGSSAYLHFTSPIRRYADLMVHRVVKSYLAGARDQTREDAAAAHITEVSAAASRAENDAVRAVALLKMSPGDEAPAVITGKAGTRSKAVIGSLAGEVEGAWPVGSEHTVTLTHVDAITGTLRGEVTSKQARTGKAKKVSPKTAVKEHLEADPSTQTAPNQTTPNQTTPNQTTPSAGRGVEVAGASEHARGSDTAAGVGTVTAKRTRRGTRGRRTSERTPA